MEAFCIETATFASKGQKALKQKGIQAELKRSNCGGSGCAFELTVPTQQSTAAAAILKTAGVPVKSTRRVP